MAVKLGMGAALRSSTALTATHRLLRASPILVPAAMLALVAVAPAGAQVFNQSDTLIYSTDISGVGTVTQAGSGTTILTGTNSYSGDTTISAGTLQIGNGGTTGTLGTGTVTNNGALIFNRSDAITVSNAISGIGKLENRGNLLTLMGANDYSGGTLLSAGTLAVDNNLALGTGDVTLAGGHAACNYHHDPGERLDGCLEPDGNSGRGARPDPDAGGFPLVG